MRIGGMQKLTLLDYPGKVACTVFLSGCNLRCPYCHNPGLVLPERSRGAEIPEAEVLSGICIQSSEDMVRAAEIISREYGCAVLCKGGHRLNDANDLLYRDGGFCWFIGRRIDNPNTHGTGCTLSSAIASGLARGYSLEQAVERAKEYLSGALEAMLDLGSGSGPMDHGFQIP